MFLIAYNIDEMARPLPPREEEIGGGQSIESNPKIWAQLLSHSCKSASSGPRIKCVA
jgi:hypothetical protein